VLLSIAGISESGFHRLQMSIWRRMPEAGTNAGACVDDATTL
jgi:hypothetical protein